MADEIKIKLSCGEVTLKKPRAKHFSHAMEEAEVSNGEMKMTKLFNLLLPFCIGQHPWGMTPVKQALGELSIEDYVKLFNEMKNMVNVSGDTEGKSELLSTEIDSPESSGLEKSSSTTTL